MDASSLLRRAAQRAHCTTPSEFVTARKATSGKALRQAHVRHVTQNLVLCCIAALQHLLSSLAQQGRRHCLQWLDGERNSKRGILRALLQGPSKKGPA